MENYLMSSPHQQFEYDNLDLGLDYELKDSYEPDKDYDRPYDKPYDRPYESLKPYDIKSYDRPYDKPYDVKSFDALKSYDKPYDKPDMDMDLQYYDDLGLDQDHHGVFLTDNMSLAKGHHHNFSISLGQELFKRIPTSGSTDSIPPLTSLASNRLLDLRHSRTLLDLQHKTVGFSDKVHPEKLDKDVPLNTPRKLTRNKSLSVGSYNLSTPLRSNTSPSTASTSSVNVSKISKTPYRHSRSLSRTRNERLVESFYTPNSFVSPKYGEQKYHDLSFDQDDFSTPTQDPQHPQLPHNLPNFNLQLSSPHYKVSPTLRRQNTLDSIKIEEQEDDAVKQLQRAKSFTSVKHANTPSQPSDLYQATHLASYTSGLSARATGEPRITSESAAAALAAAKPVSLKNIQLLQSQFSSQDLSQIDLQLLHRTHAAHEYTPNLHGNVNVPLTSNQVYLHYHQLKSYPASVNLSSIASDKDTPGLLPPMMSFLAPNLAQALTPSLGLSHYRMGSNSYLAPPSAVDLHKLTVVQPPHVSPASLKQAKEINPSFVPDLPIKIKDNNCSDPKKKHACPLCLARFQRPEHVKRHMKSHSLEKPFECDQPNCGKRFNRKDNLKAHLKKIHSII